MNRKYIWQDKQDSSMYHIGVKYANGRFGNFFSISIHAIYDYFGKDDCNLVKSKVFTTPVEIVLGLGFNE